MTATIKDGKLTIVIDTQTPSPSKSMKTLLVATTHGAVPTTAQVNGKALIVSINAYIKP